MTIIRAKFARKNRNERTLRWMTGSRRSGIYTLIILIKSRSHGVIRNGLLTSERDQLCIRRRVHVAAGDYHLSIYTDYYCDGYRFSRKVHISLMSAQLISLICIALLL